MTVTDRRRSLRAPLGTTLGAGLATVVALVPWTVLASPEAQEAGHAAESHDGGHGGIELFSPIFGHDGKIGLVWILINFAVLMWILEKLLFSKLRARTRDKHDTVKEELDKATEAHSEAKKLVEEYREKLAGLTAKAEELMKTARARAESDREQIIEQANREAEQIRESAIAAAEREAAAHRRRLEAEVIDRAVQRAEALIRERIGAPDQRKMVDDYVQRLGGVDFGGNGRASTPSGPTGGAS